MAILNYHHHGKKVPPGAVNIMRSSEFGNPFRIGVHGDRGVVVDLYRKWLWNRLRTDPAYAAKVSALHGRDLCCCCAPYPCHGEVLERAAAWLTGRDATLTP